ncbi:MAG: GNAT family N-acetyltransferase [Bacteroidia bacterium]|nr:GNAT family N-acetyltransferase [Bacteroidia bacterium]
MKCNITIKIAESTDIEAITSFQVDMALESEETTLNMTQVRKGVQSIIEDESKGKYFIAYTNNSPIGSLMLTKEWSDWNNGWYWWIQSVYVKPEYRRQGVFTALYSHVREVAKTSNVIQLRLYVDKTNLLAQQTYQKLGMHDSHYYIYEEKLNNNINNK